MRHRERIFSLALVILSWAFLQVQMSTASQALVLTATPTLETPITPTPGVSVKSLFKEDTCAPPCWFGVTVGQSTAQDVIRMFIAHPDLFFTGFVEDFKPVINLRPLIEGKGIEFNWREYRKEIIVYISNYIDITQGIVSYMRVDTPDTITLETTLEKLGKPSDTSLCGSLYDLCLALYYRDLHLIIYLYTALDSCSRGVLKEYTVNYLLYLTANGYQEELAGDVKGNIPLRVWEYWQHSAPQGLCTNVLDEVVD